ncbi:hypothetical protein BDP27DRAFT_1417495 [Rhodocollybia butyracea]|uniref:Uncharacterized protein n=1 Tax=Rhodocollybia butyracea TaxID=206335 RepID=A0A9P5PV56_9AGAR|nr:hypothetical protein BDP27DRAFT_1417495 [Rhodocollybia butyracea]
MTNRRFVQYSQATAPEPYTEAEFPRVFVEWRDAIKGFTRTQAAAFQAKLDHYLLVMPHGAGLDFANKNPNFAAQLIGTIRSFEFDNLLPQSFRDELNVIAPQLPNNPRKSFRTSNLHGFIF